MNPAVLTYVCCPACKSDLTLRQESHTLMCQGCGLIYKITDKIPILDIDAAQKPPQETPPPE